MFEIIVCGDVVGIPGYIDGEEYEDAVFNWLKTQSINRLEALEHEGVTTIDGRSISINYSTSFVIEVKK